VPRKRNPRKWPWALQRLERRALALERRALALERRALALERGAWALERVAWALERAAWALERGLSLDILRQWRRKLLQGRPQLL